MAAVDAVAWPGFAVLAILNLPTSGGIVGALGMALSALSAIRRLHAALWAIHRYHFTTWRWGRVLVWTLAVGALLKVFLAI